MDYIALSKELIQNMQAFFKTRLQNQISEAMQGESFILRYIALHNGVVVPGDISSEMCVSSTRIAIVLNNLENKGLILRQIDRADRRRIILQLTPEGEKQAQVKIQMLYESTAKMLECLGERDAKEYIRLVGRLSSLVTDDRN